MRTSGEDAEGIILGIGGLENRRFFVVLLLKSGLEKASDDVLLIVYESRDCLRVNPLGAGPGDGLLDPFGVGDGLLNPFGVGDGLLGVVSFVLKLGEFLKGA